MKICHTSDNHGRLPRFPTRHFDVLVCTGDFFPTGPVTPARAEREYQTYWLEKMGEEIREWIGNVPFLWCAGNHDFINPCSFLRSIGVDAIDVTCKWINFRGLVWYGFPYVNHIQGKWEFECEPQDMQQYVDAFFVEAQSRGRLPDVMLAHAPLVGSFDEADDGFGNIIHCGNAPLTNRLAYEDELQLPRWYLCGHVHTPGIDRLRTMRISNAATAMHIIDV